MRKELFGCLLIAGGMFITGCDNKSAQPTNVGSQDSIVTDTVVKADSMVEVRQDSNDVERPMAEKRDSIAKPGRDDKMPPPPRDSLGDRQREGQPPGPPPDGKRPPQGKNGQPPPPPPGGFDDHGHPGGPPPEGEPPRD